MKKELDLQSSAKTRKLLDNWEFIFLLGVSGGGKGTLVRSIKEIWLPDLESRSMGDLVRERAAKDPEIKEMMENGELVSNEMVTKLFKEFTVTCPSVGLMDGFPRNKAQAAEVIKLMEKNGWRGLVIDLSCDLETIIKRLLARGRADDKLDVMFKRHEDYKTLHPLVMSRLRKREDLFDFITLDGNYDAHEVLTNFLLSILRLVDIEYVREAKLSAKNIHMEIEDTDVNQMMTRFICDMFKSVEHTIAEKEEREKHEKAEIEAMKKLIKKAAKKAEKKK